MAGKKLTIKLTPDQQTQIWDATGRTATELNIDLCSSDRNEKEQENTAGGSVYIKYGPISLD